VIDPATRAAVRERAGDRCEYCSLAETAEPFFSFHIEHIVARQHVWWRCGGKSGARLLLLNRA